MVSHGSLMQLFDYTVHITGVEYVDYGTTRGAVSVAGTSSVSLLQEDGGNVSVLCNGSLHEEEMGNNNESQEHPVCRVSGLFCSGILYIMEQGYDNGCQRTAMADILSLFFVFTFFTDGEWSKVHCRSIRSIDHHNWCILHL